MPACLLKKRHKAPQREHRHWNGVTKQHARRQTEPVYGAGNPKKSERAKAQNGHTASNDYRRLL